MTIQRILFALALCGCGDRARVAGDASSTPPTDAPAPPIDAPIDAPLSGCASNDDCQAGEICHWAPQHACGHDQTRGSCAADDDQLCPDLAFFVCGCDGNTYVNACFSHAAGVDVGYGGGCRPRNGLAPCTTSSDCAPDPTFAQFCVDDPRDSCDPNNGDTGCAGVCVHGNQGCSDTLPCPPTGATDDVDSPDTETCVALVGDPADGDPAACAYTTRLRCTSATDCSVGDVCLRDISCPGAVCLGWCVRP